MKNVNSTNKSDQNKYSLLSTVKKYPLQSAFIVLIICSLLYVLISNSGSNCNDCAYDDNGIEVKSSELNSALSVRKKFYAYSNQQYSEEVVKSEALAELISKKKIARYAEDNNISVSNIEVDVLYQERVKIFDSEEKLLEQIKIMYDYDKKAYKDLLYHDILSEKVQEKLNIPLSDWLNN